MRIPVPSLNAAPKPGALHGGDSYARKRRHEQFQEGGKKPGQRWDACTGFSKAVVSWTARAAPRENERRGME